MQPCAPTVTGHKEPYSYSFRLAFTSAPFSSSASRLFVWPLSDARCRAVFLHAAEALPPPCANPPLSAQSSFRQRVDEQRPPDPQAGLPSAQLGPPLWDRCRRSDAAPTVRILPSSSTHRPPSKCTLLWSWRSRPRPSPAAPSRSPCDPSQTLRAMRCFCTAPTVTPQAEGPHSCPSPCNRALPH